MSFNHSLNEVMRDFSLNLVPRRAPRQGPVELIDIKDERYAAMKIPDIRGWAAQRGPAPVSHLAKPRVNERALTDQKKRQEQRKERIAARQAEADRRAEAARQAAAARASATTTTDGDGPPMSAPAHPRTQPSSSFAGGGGGASSSYSGSSAPTIGYNSGNRGSDSYAASGSMPPPSRGSYTSTAGRSGDGRATGTGSGGSGAWGTTASNGSWRDNQRFGPSSATAGAPFVSPPGARSRASLVSPTFPTPLSAPNHTPATPGPSFDDDWDADLGDELDAVMSAAEAGIAAQHTPQHGRRSGNAHRAQPHPPAAAPAPMPAPAPPLDPLMQKKMELLRQVAALEAQMAQGGATGRSGSGLATSSSAPRSVAPPNAGGSFQSPPTGFGVAGRGGSGHHPSLSGAGSGGTGDTVGFPRPQGHNQWGSGGGSAGVGQSGYGVGSRGPPANQYPAASGGSSAGGYSGSSNGGNAGGYSGSGNGGNAGGYSSAYSTPGGYSGSTGGFNGGVGGGGGYGGGGGFGAANNTGSNAPSWSAPSGHNTRSAAASSSNSSFARPPPNRRGGTRFTNYRPRQAGVWRGRPQDAGDLLTVNRRTFGHSGFRPHQREICEAAMEGRDVFVLMPTGGGKSLCYQLPAVCSQGVTVVVSPLLSLIQDQVDAMRATGVNAACLSGSQPDEERQAVMSDLWSHDVQTKLLYVTPEKIAASGSFVRVLGRLYENHMLARFVIDEAHCVSQWGHDFRPDYLTLGRLKDEFPEVPMMALTATATTRVCGDICENLKMHDVAQFSQSFNRPNLRYEVRKKTRNAIKEIVDLILRNPDDSGIVYCLSRRDCETVHAKLEKELASRRAGHIRVTHYHAGMEDVEERKRNHSMWSNDHCKVICATVAFGMGINKPDVRFVVHYNLPQSLTHYYQESGRAGRDGDVSYCILFYNYGDKSTLEAMIRDGCSREQERFQLDNLQRMVQYCENQVECRRVLILEFFDEHFKRDHCGKTCDNCKSGKHVEEKDVTAIARNVVEAVQRKPLVLTLNQLIQTFRGSSAGSKHRQHVGPLWGMGRAFSQGESLRLFRQLVLKGMLQEVKVSNKMGYSNTRVKSGNQSRLPWRAPVIVAVAVKTAASKKRSAEAAASAAASGKTPKNSRLRDIRARVTADVQRRLMSVLTDVRTQLAQEVQRASKDNKTVHNYTIIANKSLKEISTAVPTTMEELKQIHGIGDHKAGKYGRQLLDAISGFLRTNGIRLMGNFSAVTVSRKSPSSESASDSTDSPVAQPSSGSAPKRRRQQQQQPASSAASGGRSSQGPGRSQPGSTRPLTATRDDGEQRGRTGGRPYPPATSSSSGIGRLDVDTVGDNGVINLVHSQSSGRGGARPAPRDADDVLDDLDGLSDDDFDFDFASPPVSKARASGNQNEPPMGGGKPHTRKPAIKRRQTPTRKAGKRSGPRSMESFAYGM